MFLEMRRLRSNMIAILKYFKGRYMEGGVNMTFGVPQGRTRSNGFKLLQKRFQLNRIKNFLTARTVKNVE